MRRSEQRRAAVFALYQHELTGRPLDEVLEPGAAPFTRALAHATADHIPELDERIGAHARGWALSRIAPLEKAIMRTALLEMLHPDASIAETPIPPEGAIDEAIETTKEFCGADAPRFVNGVLDAILRTERGEKAVAVRIPPPEPVDLAAMVEAGAVIEPGDRPSAAVVVDEGTAPDAAVDA